MTQEFHYCKNCQAPIAFDVVEKAWYHTDTEGTWWLECKGLVAQPQ